MHVPLVQLYEAGVLQALDDIHLPRGRQVQRGGSQVSGHIRGRCGPQLNGPAGQ